MATTIQVSEELKKRLQKYKGHPRETYEDVITKALDVLDEEDELAMSPAFQAHIRKARKQLAAGKGIPHEEVRHKLGL